MGVDISGMTEEAYLPGGPLAEFALELQLWASFRGQLLVSGVELCVMCLCLCLCLRAAKPSRTLFVG